MTFFGLIFHNLASRRFRSGVTAAAVAVGVMSVLTLGVLTFSLRESAVQILRAGKADFTVAEKHVDDLLNSTIAESDVLALGRLPGMGRAVGALVQTDRYDVSHPLVIEVGLKPVDQRPFGVQIVQGRSYGADATHEVMIGYVLANSLHKATGDRFRIGDRTYTVAGLFKTNVSFGNSTVMFPLPTLQAESRLSGQVSLVFAQVAPGAGVSRVRSEVDQRFPQLATLQSFSDYGRSDRNLVLINAANIGGTILAAVIAVSAVLNTSLLSFIERIREFGVLRSVGWSRVRVVGLVLGEALVISVGGAAFGLLLGWAAINVLQKVHQLAGVFDPTYDAAIFGRALAFAFAVTLVGALYPALRAAWLSPLEALRRE